MTLTVERLKEVLDFDAATGLFVWKVSPARNVKPGAVAGTALRGYRHITIDRRKYFAHRLAWLYIYGTWPTDQIDHINGDRADNRLANLREATRAQNQQNRSRAVNNTSGVVGVCRDRGKWRAVIEVNGKYKFLGSFADVATATAARRQAELEHHGDFAHSLREAA